MAVRDETTTATAADAIDAFAATLPWPLDPWQRTALERYEAAEGGVLCSVPTSAGKTLVAEYAIDRALAAGRRAIYTTPVKALSNQKRRQLGDRFGADRVGLVTGDRTEGADLPVVVMTTEIARNWLLEQSPAGRARLGDLGVVVFDELHWLGDQARGVTWEECALHLPPAAKLVGLSATIGNARQLADWLSSVHAPVALVDGVPRPVTVEWLGVSESRRLVSLGGRRVTELWSPVQRLPGGRGGRALHASRPRIRPLAPARVAAVAADLLAREHDLPAIVFCFSRAGCEAAAATLATTGRYAGGPTEAPRHARLRAFLDAQPDEERAVYAEQLEPVWDGVAAHHAGLLPAVKLVVEECFAAGLIGVCVATETLALGIHMPARAVAICATRKRDDTGYRDLTASEVAQMAGRAGRRGFDDTGTVLVIGDVEDKLSPARYERMPPGRLESQFAPTLARTLALLGHYRPDELPALAARSFRAYQDDDAEGLIAGFARRVEGLVELGATTGDATGTLTELGTVARRIGTPAGLAAAVLAAAGPDGRPFAAWSATERLQVACALVGEDRGDPWTGVVSAALRDAGQRFRAPRKAITRLGCGADLPTLAMSWDAFAGEWADGVALTELTLPARRELADGLRVILQAIALLTRLREALPTKDREQRTALAEAAERARRPVLSTLF